MTTKQDDRSLRIVRGLATIGLLAILSGNSAADNLPSDAERVPFIGCASDGQIGPIAAPKDSGKGPRVSRSEAKDLAYYATDDIGVLAPRGWNCVALVGSNGSMLIVTPERHSAIDFLRSTMALTGPVVRITYRCGGTSGRFEVAQVAARLFPNQSAFVQRIVAEGTVPKSDFPSGPYPYDVVRYRSGRTVEFETPPHQDGMGTSGLLDSSDDAIFGLAIIPVDQDNSLVLVDVRVPKISNRLIGTILESTQAHYDQREREGKFDAEPSVAQIYDVARDGHLDRAQEMMDKVLRDHPHSANAHYVQAELYARKGERGLARSELARAEKLKPGLPDVDPNSVERLKAEVGAR